MKIADKIIKAILTDIEDRRGIGDELDAIDDDVKEEMMGNWKKRIIKILHDNQRYDDQYDDIAECDKK